MTLEDFIALCESPSESSSIPPCLKALWFDRQDDWDSAHGEVQNNHDKLSAAIHAYLHRKEGDISNARYWYGAAGREQFRGSLEEEWRVLAEEAITQRRPSP